MSDDYVADPDALEFDARSRWTPWANALSELRPATAAARVTPDSFGFILGAQDVFLAYKGGLEALDQYIQSGVTEFEGIANALRRTLDEYRRADDDIAEQVQRVAAKWRLS